MTERERLTKLEIEDAAREYRRHWLARLDMAPDPPIPQGCSRCGLSNHENHAEWERSWVERVAKLRAQWEAEENESRK